MARGPTPVSVVWSVSLSQEDSEKLEQILSECELTPDIEGFEAFVGKILAEEEDAESITKPRKSRAPKTSNLEQLIAEHGPLIAAGAKAAAKVLEQRFRSR